MENATKALLIAAAVLIVIVLIALGVKLLNSTSNISEQTEQTSESIKDSTMDAIGSITANLAGIDSMDDATFCEYIKNKYSGERTGKEVLELCDIIKRKYGHLHKSCGNVIHISCANNDGRTLTWDKIEGEIKKENKYQVTVNGYSIKVRT